MGGNRGEETGGREQRWKQGEETDVGERWEGP